MTDGGRLKVGAALTDTIDGSLQATLRYACDFFGCCAQGVRLHVEQPYLEARLCAPKALFKLLPRVCVALVIAGTGDLSLADTAQDVENREPVSLDTDGRKRNVRR